MTMQDFLDQTHTVIHRNGKVLNDTCTCTYMWICKNNMSKTLYCVNTVITRLALMLIDQL